LLREIMRLLRPLEAQTSIRWVNRDLAIGFPSPADGWRAMRARGVLAVVDLSEERSAVGTTVREHGMRYLRLSTDRVGLPEVEELHIVTSWIQERISEGGSVLIYDTSPRGNDAIVATAVLIKGGFAIARALARTRGLCKVQPSESQLALLHQFVAQLKVAANRR